MKTQFISYQDTLFPVCQEIRRIVFTQEQGVDAAKDVDGLDPICSHYLFFHEDVAIGTARSRLVTLEEDASQGIAYSKIERFAFLPAARGLGLGRQAFQTIMDDCLVRHPGVPIRIVAQAYLRAFYERLGFTAESDVFEHNGLAHLWMRF